MTRDFARIRLRPLGNGKGSNMEYLLLWSGDCKGMRKARIPAIPAQGITGHVGRYGLIVPDCDAIRKALPARLRKAFDRAGGFWFDKMSNISPAAMSLADRRGKPIVTLYLQPIAKRDVTIPIDLANTIAQCLARAVTEKAFADCVIPDIGAKTLARLERLIS